jgi:hypothetical protein
MTHKPAPLSTLALFSLAACKAPEPAPKAFDDLLHFFWTELDSGEDERLLEGFANLDRVVGDLEEPMEGTITPLTRGEAAVVGANRQANPQNAQGLFLANTVGCSLNEMTRLVTDPDQKKLYADTYEAYEREYDDSAADFRQGSTDRLDWSVWFEVKLLGITYEADLEEQARRIPENSEISKQVGPALFTRRYMLSPARFERDDYTYPQDWRVELYWERSPGKVVHVAGMWREASFGAIQSDDPGVQGLVLNGMKDWDDTSTGHCSEM